MLASVSFASAQLNVLEETEVDSSALNFSSAAANFNQNVNGRTYQRSPVSTFGGYQYATYFDEDRQVCLARRKLPSGSWQVIRFTDYNIPSSDSHNVATVGICALDGTIHLAFDHHADPLNYRVSDAGIATNPDSITWSTSLFSSVTDQLGAIGRLSSVTYPSFFNAPNGNLMLYYRFQGSGSGDGMIHEYNGSSSSWTSGMGKFIARTGTYNGASSNNSTSRNPYINGISYAGNRLHASWGWRESSGGAQFNHDLNYAYSDDDGRTWRNSGGSQIGRTNFSFITINSPGLIVAPIPENIGLVNQYTHYAYADGSCHVVVAHNQSGTSTKRYHHYWRSAGGNWSSEVLPFNGSRPKLVGDDNRELFLAYTSGNTLRIAKGAPNSNETSWSWNTIHSQTGRTEGGEGLIDASRWEAERILSVYGQVKANSNGAPTELNVFDYQVSPKAILPEPLAQAFGVDPLTPLTWTAGINAASHRVYLGTDPDALEYLGQQSATTFTPSASLVSGTQYFWRIDEVDTNSQTHEGLVWSFMTSGDPPPVFGEYTLYSEPEDASVRELLNVVDETKVTTLLGTGGSSPWVDRSTIYVFELPDFGPVSNPFAEAELFFNYEAKQNNLQDNDLYGLGSRNSPDVQSIDYYGQTLVLDSSDATLLQANILDNNTPLGLISTSANGSEELNDYLNLQYDSGSGAGEFVFLRLNTAGAKDGIDRATLTMSEGGSANPVDTRPRLKVKLDATSTAQTEWRVIHFGTPFDVGVAADDADPNADGETNLLEYATGQNPHAQTMAATIAELNGSKIEFRFTQSKAAFADGMSFSPEWSNTLLPDSWSEFGFNTSLESEDEEIQTILASVFAGDSKRFVRLKVTSVDSPEE